MNPIEHLNLHMEFIDDSQPRQWQRYYEPVDTLSDGLPAPILGLMLLIWQFREADLQKSFPLDTVASRLDFLMWCVSHGRHEYVALAEAKTYWEDLSKKAEISVSFIETDPLHAISKFMLLLKEARQDLPFDLAKPMGRAQFVLWYLTHGCDEAGVRNIPIPEWQKDYFFSPSEMAGLNCIQKLVYDARQDLQDTFTLPEMKEEYLVWYEEKFMTSTIKSQLQLSETDITPHILPELSQGVNVIGYAFGQLGIGEDARMATKSLVSAGIATALINFPPGNDIPQNDISMSAYVCDEIKYDINIFSLTALETGRYFAENGSRHFSSTFNIGYWPWELEEWPREWQHLYSLVDEVWASSMHSYKSIFSRSPIPVKLLPMAVTVPEPSVLTRSNFGLPGDATLFLFSFDLNSSAKRKNPSACLDAFLSAFPLTECPDASKVGLVIKVHPPRNYHPEWERLRSLSDTDPRVHIIESTLSREDLVALYNVCDCFISLHRAEGFGRNIAESMLLGTPVITTGYSGNLDYTNHLNSYLVDFDPVPLEDGDYPYGNGKFWANPDISQAALSMRAVVERPDEFKSIVRRAQQKIESNYNFNTVGEIYCFELNKIRRARL